MVEETKKLLHRLLNTVRFLIVIVVFLFVIVGVLQVQVQNRNRSIDDLAGFATSTETAARDAQKAANKTSDDLTAALKDAGQPNPAIVKALEEVHQTLILLQNLNAYVKQQGGDCSSQVCGTG